MTNPEVLGWLAAGLMVGTFCSRAARVMRPLAVCTNLAFIGYGLAASLPPVLTLHLLLLPINLWRWAEVLQVGGMVRGLSQRLKRLASALTLAACLVLSACGAGSGEPDAGSCSSGRGCWRLAGAVESTTRVLVQLNAEGHADCILGSNGG